MLQCQVVFIANEKFINHTLISNINDLLDWIKGLILIFQ